MRRPVGVKSILFSLRETTFVLPTEWPLSPCFHPHSRGANRSLGACWAFSFQPVLPSVYRPVALLFKSGTRARRLTQSPELGILGFVFSLPGTVWPLFCLFVLRGCRHGHSAAVVQWLVHFGPRAGQIPKTINILASNRFILIALSYIRVCQRTIIQ
jgi:hypothetical protein